MPRARHAWILVLIVAVSIVATRDTLRGQARGLNHDQSGYSNYSLRGVYRATYTGINLPEGLPESGISVYVADGFGNITGTKVLNLPDVFCPDVKQTATYSVDANGFGRMSSQYTSPTPGCSGSYTSSFLLHDGGKLLTGVSNSPRFVVLSEVWRRD
jgi:hypothetical protein